MDAVGGQNRGHYEQGHSRQSAPQQTEKSAPNSDPPHSYVRKLWAFAAGHPEIEKLRDVLLKLNETSLSQLRRDHQTGRSERKISKPSKQGRWVPRVITREKQ